MPSRMRCPSKSYSHTPSARAIGTIGSSGLPASCSFGKALGVAGAFVAGPERLVEWLLQKTRSYTYATAAPALLVEAVRASLRCVLSADGERRRAHLRSLIAQLRDGLAPGADAAIDAAGWALLPSATAIQPLVIGDNARALAVMVGLRERGLWVPAIRPPTVPAGTARLRIALSAAHQRADVYELLDALRTVSRACAAAQHE